MSSNPVLPTNQDAEESVLGAMMLSPAAIDAVASLLTAKDFYRQSNGDVFQAACDLRAEGTPADEITVCELLERRGVLGGDKGRARVHELAALMPAAGNVRHYALIVREMAEMRALLQAGESIQRLVHDRAGTGPELLARSQEMLFALDRSTSDGDGLVTAEDAAQETLARLTRLYEHGTEIVGLPTGFTVLDRMTSGLRAGQMIVIAGRPSMGKSALALSIVTQTALKDGKPVLLFTYEMNRQEVTERLIAMESFLPSDKIQTPSRLGRDEWEKVAHATAAIAQAPLLMDDTRTTTMAGVRTKARRVKLQRPDLALIVIDYLQLIQSGASRYESRQQDVTTISREIKLMAGELDVPVLVLSQLSRGVESRHDKRPLMSDLRESGSIEQDADLVMLLYRGEYYQPDREDLKNIAEVDIAKHRNGPVGMRKLAFVDTCARFSNLDWREEL